MSTEKAYRAIRKKLLTLRNRFLRLEFSVLLLRLFGAFAAVLLVNLLITFTSAPMGARRGLFLFSLGTLIFAVALAVVLFFRRWPSLGWIAAQAERQTPELRGDLLRGALDLWKRRDNAKLGYSVSLIEALVADALAKSEAIRERGVVGAERLRRHLPILPVAVAILAFAILMVPDRTSKLIGSLAPPDPEAIHAEMGLEISPGNVTVEAGESVDVIASFRSYMGQVPSLTVAGSDSEPHVLAMMERGTGNERTYSASIPDLQEAATYTVRFDGGEAGPYSIDVTRPPVVTGIAFDLKYPDYSGLESITVNENHGNVQALRGSEVTLRISASETLTRAALVLEGGETIPCAVADEQGATARFEVEESFSYHLQLLDADGHENRDPIRYEVVSLSDEKPFVRVTLPGEDTILDQDMNVAIRFAAVDDYGISAINLLYRKGDEEEVKVPLFRTEHTVSEVDRERNWDLTKERLLPEDVVSYYLEAWDNDEITGPKRGISRTYTVRMPSLARMYAELQEDHDADIGELEDVYEESQRLEETLEELTREIQKAEEATWDEKKKVQSVIEKQKDIEEQLREVAQQIENTAAEMEENELVTPETLERMSELQQLLQEVATDEMRKAMEELADAIEKLDQQEIEKAAEQLELSQEDFLERLDRTIDMLKQMKDMQTLDALAEGMRRMAEEQRELRMETADAAEQEMDQLAEQEEALQEELERLAEEMKKLSEESAENSQDFSEEVKKAVNQMEQKKTGSKMETAAQKLKSGEKKEATDNQKKAEQDLFDMAFRLTEVKRACNSKGQSQTRADFRESIADILYLSQGQESLTDRTGGSRASVLERRGFAERQLEVSGGIGRVIDKVRLMSLKAPQLSSQVMDLLRRSRRKADQAARQYEEGDLNLAQVRGDETLQRLNQSVIELIRSQQNFNSSCSNPNSDGQGQAKMEQMTQQQQGLNQKTSQMPMPMPSPGNPGQLSPQQQAGLERLAAEQQQIRKGIEEMMQEVEGTSDILGSLDDVMEEMRKVERSLEEADLSPEMRERQERILSRMLDAQRSMRDRGYKRQRRSRTGGEADRVAPAELPRSLSEARERIREDLIRMPNLVYPAEYEELIRSYFKTLTEKQD